MKTTLLSLHLSGPKPSRSRLAPQLNPSEKLEADRGDAVSSDEAPPIVATLPGLSTALEPLWPTQIGIQDNQTPAPNFVAE